MKSISNTSTEKPTKPEGKMKYRLMVGFALTLLGALVIEVTVLLALGNLVGLGNIPPYWLIGTLLAGGGLLVFGWFCRATYLR